MAPMSGAAISNKHTIIGNWDLTLGVEWRIGKT